MSERVLGSISKIIGGAISADLLAKDFKVSYVADEATGDVGSFAIWLPLSEENCDDFSGLTGLYDAVVGNGDDIPLNKFAAVFSCFVDADYAEKRGMDMFDNGYAFARKFLADLQAEGIEYLIGHVAGALSIPIPEERRLPDYGTEAALDVLSDELYITFAEDTDNEGDYILRSHSRTLSLPDVIDHDEPKTENPKKKGLFGKAFGKK